VDGVLLPPSDATKRRRAAAARARERAWRAVCTVDPIKHRQLDPSGDQSGDNASAANLEETRVDMSEMERIPMPPLALLPLLPLPQSFRTGNVADATTAAAVADATTTETVVATPPAEATAATLGAERNKLLNSLKCRVVASGCLSAHGGGSVRSLAGHYLAQAEYSIRATQTALVDGQVPPIGDSSSGDDGSSGKIEWGEACLLSLGSDERAMLWTLPPDLDAEGIVAQPAAPPPSAPAPKQQVQLPADSPQASATSEDPFPLPPSSDVDIVAAAALPAESGLAGAAPVPDDAPLVPNEVPGPSEDSDAANENVVTAGTEAEKILPPGEMNEVLSDSPEAVAAPPAPTTNNSSRDNNNIEVNNGNNDLDNINNEGSKLHAARSSRSTQQQQRQQPSIGLAGALMFGLGRHDRCSGGGWPSVDWRGAASLEVHAHIS